MKYNIGCKVKISEKKSRMLNLKHGGFPPQPKWYSAEIYTIIGFKEKEEKIVILDRELPQNSGNMIHTKFLESIKKERKKKLLKLNNL